MSKFKIGDRVIVKNVIQPILEDVIAEGDVGTVKKLFANTSNGTGCMVEFDFFTDDEYIDIEELIEDRIDGLYEEYYPEINAISMYDVELELYREENK